MLARPSTRYLLTRAAAARGVRVFPSPSVLTPANRWAGSSSSGSKASSRDILDILESDHRQFEDYFRALRNRESDRVNMMRTLSNILVAHNEAEELHFYPSCEGLRDNVADGSKEIPHDVHEHRQAQIALLAVLEEPDTTSKSWEDKFMVLVTSIATHMDEEERKNQNLARLKLTPQQRQQIGDAFLKARDEMLARNVGDVNYVRRLVEERASMMDKLKVKMTGVIG